jgi:hypothetical protein
MIGENDQAAEKLLALAPNRCLDRLAGLIAAKLLDKNGTILHFKQVIVGASPVYRSNLYSQ